MPRAPLPRRAHLSLPCRGRPAPLRCCSCTSLSPCRGHPPPRSEALRLFNAILHIIPLLVVESRKEADEVRELVSIARWVARLLGCNAC